MFWEEAPDMQHQLVKKAMPRNRLVTNLQNFHFCDNTTLDSTNKCGKVRPLLYMVCNNLRKHAKLTCNTNWSRMLCPETDSFTNLQNFHFCDNTTLDRTNKCGKVRLLLDMVCNNLRKHAKLTKCLNIDESMIPYYGKFGQTLKQRMPLKPIRSGYKVWCLNL